jgi:preprotein translocase subunit SecG
MLLGKRPLTGRFIGPPSAGNYYGGGNKDTMTEKNLNALKKCIFCFIYMFMTIVVIFASGNADEQSQALLYKQQRTTWPNAPENAVFYECYLMSIKDKNGENNYILLDSIMLGNDNGVILVNTSTSMKIVINGGKEMLGNENEVYKCVVLYSNSMFGIAMVNIFKSEQLNKQIGYYYGNRILDFNIIENDDYEILNLLAFDDDIERKHFFYFPKNKRSFLKLDQWPNYSSIEIVDGLTLLRRKEGDRYDVMHSRLSNYPLLRF